MSAVHNAGDGLGFGFGDFGGHEIHVMHDVRRRWSSSAATAGAAPTRRERRQTICGSSSGCNSRKSRVETMSQLHVLVEQRRAAIPLLRPVISAHRYDHVA